jgi:hypothetical protein
MAVSIPATTHGSVFDALFVRLLEPAGAFKSELRAAGYDPEPAELELRITRGSA